MSEIPEFNSGQAQGQVSDIGAVVSQGVNDVGGFIRQYFIDAGESACVKLGQFEVELDKVQETAADLEGWAVEAVEAIDWAQDAAIFSWGMDPGASGGLSFPDWIATRSNFKPYPGYVPGAPGGLAWGMDVLAWLPADGFTAPPTIPDALEVIGLPRNHPHNLLVNLGSGIRLVGSSLAGAKIRELHASWLNQVRQLVGPTNWPTWRSDLAYYVGSADWQPGQPVTAGYLKEYRDLVAQWEAMHIDLRADCEAEREGVFDLAFEPGNTKRERNRLIAASAVLIAALLRKGKRR